MKKLLSLIVFNNSVDAEPLYEGVEVVSSAKQAKGKYCAIVDGDFSYGETQAFLTALEQANTDILAFDGGCCFKTGIVKNVECNNKFYTEISAVMSSKSISKVSDKPFTFGGMRSEYSEDSENLLKEAVAEFKKCKAKLSKEVYAFAFDMFCGRLITYYISAMLAIYKKKIATEKLVDFDNYLKEDVVLFLALEKRFSYCKLQKLRDKQFKINFITAGKFKKAIKNGG